MKKISVAFFMVIIFILCFMSGSLLVQKSDSDTGKQESVQAGDESQSKEQTSQALEQNTTISTTEAMAQDNQMDRETGNVTAANSNKVESACQYIIKYETNHIVVYEADGVTIFEETDIDESHLSEQMLVKLKEGIPVPDEETLYSLLESFSS